MRGEKIKVNIGDRFGRLLILKETNRKLFSNGRVDSRMFLCLCDCGNKKEIRIRSLKEGLTKSCGCYQKERTEQTNGKNWFKKIHGQSYLKGIHRETKSYRCWRAMKQRCYNKNNRDYSNYGGRGIKVCKRWFNSFNNFYKDMGESPENMSIDRINVNGNYCKSNCRWATSIQQANNKRNNKKYAI